MQKDKYNEDKIYKRNFTILFKRSWLACGRKLMSQAIQIWVQNLGIQEYMR